MSRKFYLSVTILVLFVAGAFAAPARIGSKIFTEAYVLAEILAVHLESANFPVERMSGLGATGVTEEAMKTKKIDLIVDYTGSITQAYFSTKKRMTIAEIRTGLEAQGFTISDSLGFNNTYALAVNREWAKKNDVRTFSDLKKLPQVRAAFTPEFTSRRENWPELQADYEFHNFEVQELDHQLAYQAVRNGKADVVEAYSTDAKLKEFDLLTLQDDRKFFPNYDAVIMTSLEWKEKNPAAWTHLQKLVGQIPEETMINLNAEADLEKKPFRQIAEKFLKIESDSSNRFPWATEVLQATKEHLVLVLIPVFFAFLLGVPLAYLTYRFPRSHSSVGSLASLFQTIPALAFLTFLIPFVGIGTFPALIVLTLYALLPIFVSSYQGFASISNLIHLSCQTLNLEGFFKLRKIEFPLALPSILAGLQTSLITTVASATLAALIGAGGYGKKIIAGLAVNDMKVVLMGAIPSALLALLFQFIFSKLNRRVLKRSRRN